MVRSLTRIACLMACLGGLAACDDLGEALGMEHRSPDEGTVATNPPLSVPPDFALKPPRETAKNKDPDSTENGAPTDPSIHDQNIPK